MQADLTHKIISFPGTILASTGVKESWASCHASLCIDSVSLYFPHADGYAGRSKVFYSIPKFL